MPKNSTCKRELQSFKIVESKFNLPPMRVPCSLCEKSAEFCVKGGRTAGVFCMVSLARVDMLVHYARENSLDFAQRLC